MKTCFLQLLLLISLSISVSAAQPADTTRYIIFLHNKFVEDHGPVEKHPSYGRPEYPEILARLRADGFIVLSERRPANTDEETYAVKVGLQIDSLLHTGVKPSQITIVGTSKGGNIAQFVSSQCKSSQLNFVIVGASFKHDFDDVPGARLCGRILSITEASDTNRINLSEQPRFRNSRVKVFKEITLNTGLHHGFLFKALDDWIIPTENWARLKLPYATIH